MPIISLREEASPAYQLEANLRAGMIAVNTMATQMDNLFKQALEGSSEVKYKEENIQIKDKINQLEKQAESLKAEVEAQQQQKESWEGRRKNG